MLTLEEYGELSRVDPLVMKRTHEQITRALQTADLIIPTLQDMQNEDVGDDDDDDS